MTQKYISEEGKFIQAFGSSELSAGAVKMRRHYLLGAEESEAVHSKYLCKTGCPECPRQRRFDCVLAGLVCKMQ